MNQAAVAAAGPEAGDKYEARQGVALMSGTQALVRLAIEQRWRDVEAGLKTAGFISGYRGSPLGGYDQELWRNGAVLQALDVRFQPGVNEDLAATAVWGSQFVPLYPGAKYDGVFGIWYGKTPGVDRSGDAFQHANTAGTSKHGGVVAVVGDDHGCKSSSRAGQSDFQLKAAGIPVLYPSSVQEILDFGIHAIGMSRYSGCWVGLKVVSDVVESTSAVDLSLERLAIAAPALETDPPGGLHIRAMEPALDMEARLYQHKLPAAVTYARANGLNRILLAPAKPRLGIVSAGKSWSDLRAALALLGLDDAAAEAAGLRLLKFGMSWPLDRRMVADFVEGLDTVLVVEEKRPFIEEQLKMLLLEAGSRVRVIGKEIPTTPKAPGQLPLAGELNPQVVASAIAALLDLPAVAGGVGAGPGAGVSPPRLPNFCSGCPHNRSTVVPEGSRAMAGIGCSSMAVWVRPDTTSAYTHMGAEGALWVGQAPFTNEKHVFVNMGDGTFYHSGSLALRQAVAAKLRVTYKVLFNGYVSMTGGQPHDGDVTVRRIVDLARAEGVDKVVVVSDDPSRHAGGLPELVDLVPRTELESVQLALREYPGVSVLVYDQACATESRRQRKRNPALAPKKRAFINPEVCEGCGDCGTASNCMSVEPLETELGRKRRINQSSCNQDLSCVEGFCPSFVTVEGGAVRRPGKARADTDAWPPLPAPPAFALERTCNVVLAGIGGTGIITVGTILGQAAHLDGNSVSVLDLTGLAQKYGAVMSHLRFMPGREPPVSARLGAGEADVLIGCDLIVAAGQEALSKLSRDRSFTVVNTAVNPTFDFPGKPDWKVDGDQLVRVLQEKSAGKVHALDASAIASALMGDAIAINMFLLGYAWQLGRIPVSLESLLQAIRDSGVEVDFNVRSFEWGRRAAVDLERVEQAARGRMNTQVIAFQRGPLTRLEDIVADRARRLEAYQDARYAASYVDRMEAVRRKDAEIGAQGRLARAVARNYFKVLADKDEFEVARLYSSPEFRRHVEVEFDGDVKLHLHVGAWPLARRDARGKIQKREVGPWIFPALKVLQGFKWARGTWLDPFRNTPERELARALRTQYEGDLALVLEKATLRNLEQAVALANLPEKVRGFGEVRRQHAERAATQREQLLRELHADA